MQAVREPSTIIVPPPKPTWGEWFQDTAQGVSSVVSGAVTQLFSAAVSSQVPASQPREITGVRRDEDSDKDWSITEALTEDEITTAQTFAEAQDTAINKAVEKRVWDKVVHCIFLSPFTEPDWKEFFKEISNVPVDARNEIVDYFKLHAEMGIPRAQKAYRLSYQRGYALHTCAEIRALHTSAEASSSQ